MNCSTYESTQTFHMGCDFAVRNNSAYHGLHSVNLKCVPRSSDLSALDVVPANGLPYAIEQ